MKKYRDGKKCPECLDQESIVKIEYGYPGEEMRKKHDKGEIKLGGCTIDEDNPEYHCNKCDNEWNGGKYDSPFLDQFMKHQITYHNNGQKWEEGYYKDGKKEGEWASWYENGQKKSEGTWKDGKEDGLHTQWYENGQKRREGTYKDGIQVGKYTYYN